MFKKTTLNSILPLVLFIFLCVLNSCSSGAGDSSTSNSIFSQTPEHQEVVIAFAENLAKGKIAASKKYATEVSAELLDLSIKLGAKLEIDPDASYSIVKDSLMGKKALVQIKDNNKAKAKVEWYDMVMVDGQWLVDLDRTMGRNRKMKAKKKREAQKKRRAADQKATDKLFSTN